MALFKMLHGDESNISLDITPFHEGWAYITTSGYYYVDLNVGTAESPNNQRIKLNAANAETLCGLTLDEIKELVATQDTVVLAEAQSYTDTAITELSKDVEANTATIEEVKAQLPTKVSQLENDSKFISEEYVEAYFKRLNSDNVLRFYCIEDVTVVINGVSTLYPANSNVEVKFLDTDVWEIIPTSDNSILALNAFPGALGTYYSWLEGVKQFSNILFDMNTEDMYSKWSQGNQGSYQVQYAQYLNCIFWSDNPYISDVDKRTNYTLYYTSQLPLCYSTIPDNTFKAFYLAFNVNSDPNWGNQAYRDSFAKATWATQVFSYYGARTIGIFGHDDPDFNIILPKDCRGLMSAATAIENAGTFDAVNVTNFGAKSGSWRDAFGWCSALRNLYIKNLKVDLNVSWSPIEYDSIYFIISTAANTNKITISVSPYTYNLLGQSDFELAASKNIDIELLTANYVEDRRLSAITTSGDGTKVLSDDGAYKTLPTKTSQLENDSNFLTEHQSLEDYVTKTDLLNEINSAVSGFATAEDIASAVDSIKDNVSNQDAVVLAEAQTYTDNAITEISETFLSEEDMPTIVSEVISQLPENDGNGGTDIATATSTDGVAYTATVPSITELTVGASFIMIPDTKNTSTTITLNVNDLGAKNIRRRQNNITSSPVALTNGGLEANQPVRVIYDGTYWIVEGQLSINGSDISGNVPMAEKAVLDPTGAPLMGYVKDIAANGNTLTLTKGSGATSTINLSGSSAEIIEIPRPTQITSGGGFTADSVTAMQTAVAKIVAAEAAGKTVVLVHKTNKNGYLTLNYSYVNGVYSFVGLDPSYIGEVVADSIMYLTRLEYDYTNNVIKSYSPASVIADYGEWIESWEDANEVETIPSFNAVYKMCQSVLEQAKAYVDAIPHAEEASF